MFWRFGGYANISTIDTILDKPDFSLEELLDETDLIQELKQHNTKLIEYLREDKVLQKLLEYVVAPKLEAVDTPDNHSNIGHGGDDDFRMRNRLGFGRPRSLSRTTDTTENDEDEQEKKRNRYAFVACEVLSSDTWSIYEALTENRQLTRDFWEFLKLPAPLDPLQASYFTKVNESLFEKKTEEMMELLRELPDAVPNLLKHVECPMIMDLLLKIIALDRSEGGQGIVEWLYSKDIIPSLLSCLGPEHSWVVQTAAGDFIKAIITISANASQNEQQCIGPNELTRQLVSKTCVEQLISYMLNGGNPLTVGVGIIIEVIRKNNSDYDPDVGTEAQAAPSSRDPIYLGTLLRMFAQNVPKFMSLMTDGPARKQNSESTFGQVLEPLGFDRFKTCELMAELLHCSNMGLLNEVGAEQLISTRDTERHRLRDEGKLVPLKEDDLSADELTMRLPHASHDESRKLEVTNADDDGFEEVEPSKEMSEDTSHEFVKPEHEEAQSPAAFVEKDEDDFVDEPLSSPRLAVGADKVNEQQFEEPDLVVAPLSPAKPKPAEPVLTTEENVPNETAKNVDGDESSSKDNSEKAPEKTEQSSETSSTDPVVITPASSEHPAIQVETENTSNSEPIQKRDFSPHPEDTPAPLFSSSKQTPERVPAQPQQEAGLPSPTADSNVPDESTPTQTDATATPRESGQEETKRGDDTPSIEPVVGDYLKMQFVEHRVVPTILTFFFRYPWNNFLHNVVYDIVQQVFNGPMDRGYNPTLAVSLFEAADVTAAIIEGQQVSDESQAKNKTRMGYMGHLTLIAEEVVKFTERHPPELLSESVLNKVMSQEWINYVEGALAETRERDNAILGGVRPEVAMGHRGSIGGGGGLGGAGLSGLGGGGGGASSGGGSNALAEAGLNGGLETSDSGGNGIGPFAISTGTLMSGFGSSSDEDDDEGDGDDEDVNSEFHNYTDSIDNKNNNTDDDGSLGAPSIPPPPPPPPPLNVPPSRARRQLAARLAMHQKNSEAGKASSATMMNANDDDEDKGTDPFADADDNFDYDDDDVANDDGDLHDITAAGERGAWWRGVVGRSGNGSKGDNADDDDEEDDFGDFAMAEDDKGHGNGGHEVAKPEALNPNKESASSSSTTSTTGRALGSLWPFSSGGGTSKDDKAKDAESDAKQDNMLAPAVSKEELISPTTPTFFKDMSGSQPPPAVEEVKEAKRRTSIEDDEDDEAYGAEVMAGSKS